jgi:isocitrate/isopropylmalate dehydrogenase
MHNKNEPVVLVFSYVGFSQSEIVISNFEEPQNIKLLQIEMAEEVATMGIVVVHKRNFFQRIGDWFKRTFTRKKKKEEKRSCEVRY